MNVSVNPGDYIDFQINYVKVPFAEQILVSYEKVPVPAFIKTTDELVSWLSENACNPILDAFLVIDNRNPAEDYSKYQFSIGYKLFGKE